MEHVKNMAKLDAQVVGGLAISLAVVVQVAGKINAAVVQAVAKASVGLALEKGQKRLVMEIVKE